MKLKTVKTDKEQAMRDAVEAWLDGNQASLAEIRNRAVMANARRKLIKVLGKP